MSTETLIIEAIIILVLIVLNGFFSTSEIAIISSRRGIIDKLAQGGDESAMMVGRMKNSPERFLATIQVGLTVVSTLASVIGGVAAIEFLKPLILSIPIAPVQEASGLIAVGIVTVAISYALLVMGELAPKSIGLRHSEKIACLSAKPIEYISRISGIFVRLLTSSTAAFLKILGIEEARKDVFAPRDEIKYYIKEGRAKGGIEETEAQLLHGVFEFSDTPVKKIMVPKPKFSAIDADSEPGTILKFIAETGFSRYPVYIDNPNQIAGILFNKDVFKAMEKDAPIILKELIRSPYFVPNSVMISRLLREMQRRRVHMAIVLDEHGDVDGLVTIEDILEEIVGEIADEYDVEKGGLIERLRDGTMIVDASTSLGDLTDVGLIFGEEEKDEFNTLAGFMLAKLQRIPGGGEFVIHKGHRYTVVDMEKNRIAKVKVEVVRVSPQGAVF